MIKYIIFNNENNAIEVNNRITNNILNTSNDGITNNYCNIKKHPNLELWAIVIHPNYINYFTQEELGNSVELDSEWIKTV